MTRLKVKKNFQKFLLMPATSSLYFSDPTQTNLLQMSLKLVELVESILLRSRVETVFPSMSRSHSSLMTREQCGSLLLLLLKRSMGKNLNVLVSKYWQLKFFRKDVCKCDIWGKKEKSPFQSILRSY